MPSLPSQKISILSADGKPFRATVGASVTGAGEFSLEIPKELQAIAYRLCSRGGLSLDLQKEIGGSVEVSSFRRGEEPRVRSKVLAYAVEFLRVCADEFLRVEEITERVICYRTEINVSFWQNDDGTIAPNGSTSTGPGGKWWTPKVGKHLHATERAPFASVGLVARVFDRTTYKRATGDTVVWKTITVFGRGPDDADAAMLNGFTGLFLDPEIHDIRVIPYTPEAARFFVRMILGICEIGRRLDEFFSDDDLIQSAIKSGSVPMLGDTQNQK